MSVENRLITVEPTPVRPRDAVSWVIPWEVCRKCRPRFIRHSASDPVTTEAFGPRWRLASPSEAIYERHNTPTPRLWSGRVKT